ncbi:hypothetical protein M9H77_07578 [Catharanthus roseus]|uniref:Uncharacterized protein n=1 Tax=Catharanthus roseus TaxID=4058 RepID=A0ACC0BVC8_CATRO|nr:hypothetical protein M9H77_07578 [Catharanthus roseus]
MPVKISHPFHKGGYQGRPQVRSGRRGGLGGRGYHRPQEEFPRHEAWLGDNLYEHYGDNPHSWPKKGDTPKVAYKDHSKPKVEEKGKLITNPTRCFKCNRVGHISLYCPTKQTLVFSEDLNGWTEKSDDDCQEGIVDKDESACRMKYNEERIKTAKNKAKTMKNDTRRVQAVA